MKLGFITPSSNSCLEPTVYSLLTEAPDVSAHFARLSVTQITLDGGSTTQFDSSAFLAPAEQLADAGVDVLVWAGTSGSWLGFEHDRQLAERLHIRTGIATTTSTLATLEACRAYGVTDLGIVTPYTEPVNERIRDVYATEGIAVSAASGLGITVNKAFADVTPDQVGQQLREVVSDRNSLDAATVLCTNVFGAKIAAQLETELGLPIFDSVVSTVWAALRRAGDKTVRSEVGLLRDGTFRTELQAISDHLQRATGCDRTTIRLDAAERGLHVDLAAAESHRPGVRPIRKEGGLDQRRLNTVEWLEARREVLIQPSFTVDPFPPQALIDIYGVQAQMLGPIQPDPTGAMVGWLSAHSLRERDWASSDVRALQDACHAVEQLVSAG